MNENYLETRKNTKDTLATIGLTLGIVAFFTTPLIALPGLICSLCSIHNKKYGSIGVAGIILNGFLTFILIAAIVIFIFFILIIAFSADIFYDISEVALRVSG